MERTQYFSALKKEFEDDSKFQKLAENPLPSDDKEIRQMLHLTDVYTDKEFTIKNKSHLLIKSSYSLGKDTETRFLRHTS
jgi:hypothetical protein